MLGEMQQDKLFESHAIRLTISWGSLGSIWHKFIVSAPGRLVTIF